MDINLIFLQHIYFFFLKKVQITKMHISFGSNGSVDTSFSAVTLPGGASNEEIIERLHETLDPEGFLEDLKLDPSSIQAGSR